MLKAQDYDVVIVGAGLAGSALAVALSGSGLRIGLIEARPLAQKPLAPALAVDDYDSRVSALTLQSQALLERLGVWPGIAAQRLCPYREMSVWDAEGTGCIDFDCAEVGAPVLGHIVENQAIINALLARLEALGDVQTISPAKLQSCVQLEAGGIRLELDGGNCLETQLLVAADGALSGVRSLLGFTTREWDYGHSAIVATVEVELPHQAKALQRFLPSGPLAFLPLAGAQGRHYCSIVWSLQEELVEEILALDDDQFCRRLAAAFEQKLGRVLAASPRIAFPLRQRHAVDYIQEGVALIGDAAHTIHPLAGQGINLGFADVAVLAEEVIAARARGAGPGDLAVLRRYQRRRKGENLLMMTAMEGFKQLFEQRALPVRWLRNTGMRTVAGIAPLKQRLMRHALGLGR